ncbi:hypothetical protein QFC19_002971 [Naganishia cerealis]|uniref:Uncharacterized protein n=1 Tax=Naganishia cerealis TaxID=610337 RepID=A0ACC2W5U9_9TREE|nr:hypothetical protein QFC19_002971 [Naganishia cerealis]
MPISDGGIPLVGGPPGLAPSAALLLPGIPNRGEGAAPVPPGRDPFGRCDGAGAEGSRLAPKVRGPTGGEMAFVDPLGEAISREMTVWGGSTGMDGESVAGDDAASREFSTQTLRALTRELTTLTSSPPEGVRIHIANEGDLLSNGGVIGIVQGPSGTPYMGGYFKVRFCFADVDFPNMPPKCEVQLRTMVTKIFHPNISKTGEICVDTLKKGWKREYGIEHVLVTIKCLLIVPNPESALDEEAGKLLLEDYQEYYKTPPSEFLDILDASSAAATTSTLTKSSSLPLQPHKHAFINGTATPPLASSTSQPTMAPPVKKVASGAPAVVGSGGAAKVKRGLKRL